MLKNPPTKQRFRRTAVATAALFCLIATACGGADANQGPTIQIGQPAPAPVAGSGPEYGATIDEYTAATRVDSVPAAEQSAVVPAGADPAAAGAAPDGSAGATGSERAGTHPTRLQQASDTGIDGFNTLEWADLVAPGFTPEEIYERYQDQLESVESGSPEANELYATMQAEYDSGANVNAELDGLEIQLAGFVAPLSFDDDVLSEFLLVPYFGACIHVPPPPPNQTILVTFENVEDGLPLDDSWGPVWVAGKLTVDLAETDLATASYTLSGVTTRAYQGF